MFFLSFLASPALACGGFFCNNATPVDQGGEEVIFGIDSTAGTVSVQVRVAYQGPSESFAWVVPVPGIPTLGVSSNTLFDVLRLLSSTVFSHSTSYDNTCDFDTFGDADADTDADSDTDSDVDTAGSDDTGPNPVEVVAIAEVGPYDTVVLQADSSAALVVWLAENGYDVSPGFDAAIAPYLAAGQYVLALKLLKDRDDGDLQPISLTYPGTSASIPIQLTAVAAVDNMPLEVYVFGDSRAVPTSYLHVIPNPFAHNWFTDADDWSQTITLAANEAGGQAFATDFSGSTAGMTGAVYKGEYDSTIMVLPTRLTAGSWWNEVTGTFPPTAALLEVFQRQLPVPDGVDPTTYYNCAPCYAAEAAALPFDSVVATADLDATVVQPLRDAEALFAKYPRLTRLTSSLDAKEMTVDPVFSLNPDMEQNVARSHTADIHYACAGALIEDSPRTLTVAPEDWVAYLPSSSDVKKLGMSDFAYLTSLTTYAALRVEKTSSTGQPIVLQDQTPWLEGQLAKLAPEGNPNGLGDPSDVSATASDADPSQKAGAGCGCQTANVPGSTWLLLAAALTAVIARNRRPYART